MTLEQLMEQLEEECKKTPDKPVIIDAGSEMKGFLVIATFQFEPPKGADPNDKAPYLTASLPKDSPVTTVNCLKESIEFMMKSNNYMKTDIIYRRDVKLQHSFANDGAIDSPKVLPIKSTSGGTPLWFRIVA